MHLTWACHFVENNGGRSVTGFALNDVKHVLKVNYRWTFMLDCPRPDLSRGSRRRHVRRCLRRDCRKCADWQRSS